MSQIHHPHMQLPLQPGTGQAGATGQDQFRQPSSTAESAMDNDYFMYSFKVVSCPRRYVHDWSKCPYAHKGEVAARRDPRKVLYWPEPCPDASKNPAKCPRGRNCAFSHSVFEYWLHPGRYRTQMCSIGANCKRTVCFFAHNISELRTPTYPPMPMHLYKAAGGDPAAEAGEQGALAACGSACPGVHNHQQQQVAQQWSQQQLLMPQGSAAAAAAAMMVAAAAAQPGYGAVQMANPGAANGICSSLSDIAIAHDSSTGSSASSLTALSPASLRTNSWEAANSLQQQQQQKMMIMEALPACNGGMSWLAGGVAAAHHGSSSSSAATSAGLIHLAASAPLLLQQHSLPQEQLYQHLPPLPPQQPQHQQQAGLLRHQSLPATQVLYQQAQAAQYQQAQAAQGQQQQQGCVYLQGGAVLAHAASLGAGAPVSAAGQLEAPTYVLAEVSGGMPAQQGLQQPMDAALTEKLSQLQLSVLPVSAAAAPAGAMSASTACSSSYPQLPMVIVSGGVATSTVPGVSVQTY